jgi:hypothetical protein
MPLVLANRVQETTTTTGTGAVTLGGTSAGLQSFAVIGDGNYTFYTITDDTDWEIGLGKYTSSTQELSREQVFSSSNSNQKVDWSVGSKTVFVTLPASQAQVTVPLNIALPSQVVGTSSVGSATVEIFEGIVIEYLSVAGGGGGGNTRGGGGGAGGYLTSTLALDVATNYTVTIGAGGAGATGVANEGVNGSDSVFSTVTSIGGGGGGSRDSTSSNRGNGSAGGSGGGGCGNNVGTGGAGTPGQGFAGGNSGSGTNSGGGGGGGASEVGGTGTVSTGGDGGDGLESSISGSATYYAGGGGGGEYQTGVAGLGGLGGGGDGASQGSSSTTPIAGSPGTDNLGGGGGGGSGNGGNGGNGGSGVVILKYIDTLTISNPGGGLTFSTSTAVSGYKITTVTAGTGSMRWD